MPSGQIVLVVTKRNDTTADYLFRRMESRRVPYLRLNVDSFPEESLLRLQVDSTDGNSTVTHKGAERHGDSFYVVFYRRKPQVSLTSVADIEARKFGEQEYGHMIYWWLRTLQTRFFDTEEAIERSSNKWAQLICAKEIGLHVPPTLITNDPIATKSFYGQNQGRVIAKTLGGFGALRDDGFYSVYSSLITPVHLNGLGALKFGPAIFQGWVEKDFELRVTVVREEVFACKIDSQKSERTKLDWRRYDVPNTPHSRFDIPSDLSRKLLSMMHRFGIHFVAFDIAVTRGGDFVFFEMNPCPQWVWIEALTGLPITDALIDAFCA